jgi:hypothetical protein
MSILGGLIALTNKPEYKVEGTFREKNSKPVNISTSFASLFSAGIGVTESEAMATLKSRKMMQVVIERMDLQGFIFQKNDQDTYLKRMKENLIVEYARLMKLVRPVLKDSACAVKVSAISYEKEEPFILHIQCQPNGQYEVFNSTQESLGVGELGKPFQYEEIHFTLLLNDNLSISNEPYFLVLSPIKLVADYLLANLDIELDRYDKNLLKLSFQHRDRQFACEFINTLMVCYQDYLKMSHQQQAKVQLNYLEKKKNDTKEHLVNLMERHAEIMSVGFSTSGIADTEKELQFLAERQHRFKEKLFTNQLETKRLQNLQAGQYAYYESYNALDGYPHIINNMLEKMRTLKQQRDFLELAISKSPLFDIKQFQESFKQQFEELKQIQHYQIELAQMIDCCQKRLPVDRSLSLFKDQRFLISSWHDKLLHSSSENRSFHHLEEEYLAYLTNLTRLFQVREKIIRERLIHQQDPSLEFQGINLHAAEELYITYCKTINELESEQRQNDFLLVQLQDSHFEISSLSPILKDPVSQTMIKQASQLLLDLKDQNNRSFKEQERLKEDLAIQKNFLNLHLQQISQTIELKQNLFEEKIHTLQNIMLELIHQQISLFEKNLNDHTFTRMENYKQEKLLLEQQLADLRQEMALLPQKWVSEQIIKHNVEMNRLIVKEVANIVETQNITHNLEIIQSAPVDLAVAPLLPKSPHLLLHAFFGGLLGACLSLCFFLTRSIMKGLSASSENLKMCGQYVAGYLSHIEKIPSIEALADQDLNTLRRLEFYVSEDGRSIGQALLLIEGKGPKYEKHLASLFKKRGLKTLILPLSFNQFSNQETGLLQYLEEKIDFPVIKQTKEWDYIEAGGTTRFSTELLKSIRFQELLNQLRTQYDWILATTYALPNQAETESLSGLFSHLAVSIHQETLPELESYLRWQKGEKKIAFMFVQDSYQ